MRQRLDNIKGFTLIEVLVVIALTAIVMFLVFQPLIQTFGLTRRSEAMIRAQDNARLAMQQISRDLANAMYVYDNTTSPIYFRLEDDASGNPVYASVYYAKVDMVLPRLRGYCTQPDSVHGSNPREFSRGDEAAPTCPYDNQPLELRPVQPLAPDTKIVRYFIGLRDPSKPYSNAYTNRVAASSEENLFVLYRAEFEPYDTNLFDDTSQLAQNLRDPGFFYGPHAAAWRRICRPVVTLDDIDLVSVDYSTSPATVTPTVKFTPTAVYNDPMVPTNAGEENPEHRGIPPAKYKATYGNWVLPYEITLRRSAEDGGPAVYKTLAVGNEMWIYRMSGNNPTDAVFNITGYQNTAAQSPYGAGEINPSRPELAFTVDTTRGVADFAIPHVNATLSNSLSSILGGKTAVSFSAPTADVNYIYDTAPPQERARMYEFHLANSHDIGTYMFDMTLLGRVLGNSTVVPGLERVIGPNCTQGILYGTPLQYTRVPFWNLSAEPGLNQYKIDVDYPVLDGSGVTMVGTAGSAAVFFHSDQTAEASGVRLPEDTDLRDPSTGNRPAGAIDSIYVFYCEQNNKKGDSLRANYVTKSLMTITLGIRVFDGGTGKPESIRLTNKVRLRNVAS